MNSSTLSINLLSVPIVFRSHGIVAALYAFVFYLEAFGIALPLLSLEAQHPDFVSTAYSRSACFFAAVAISTFAAYEIFLNPSLPSQFQNKLKTIFFSYYIP